jgi:gliding motility-associated-like protein
MYSKIFKGLFVVLILSSIGLTAQVVNRGVLYISENTKLSIASNFNNQDTGSFRNDGSLLLYADFNNDGAIGFDAKKMGYTQFEGEKPQKITGLHTVFLNDVLFDNYGKQPAFDVRNELSVAGDANFNAGIINNKQYDKQFIFESGSSYSNLNSKSYIEGIVKKTGDSNFVFPIGDNGISRMAAISAPSTKSSSFACAYFFKNSDDKCPHILKANGIQLLNDQEYWTLEKVAGKSDVMLTLSLNTETTPLKILEETKKEIHIVRWDAVKYLWVDEGGVFDAYTKTVTTPANVGGYNVFTTAIVDYLPEILPCSEVVVYNAVSANGDGINDFFKIDGLYSCNAENTLRIYNRYGRKVYQTEMYGNANNNFNGYVGGCSDIQNGMQLTEGTYYYVLDFVPFGSTNKTRRISKSGYLYLSF